MIAWAVLILLSVVGWVVFRQVQSIKISRQQIAAREEAWPPVRDDLRLTLEAFDEKTANGEVNLELLASLDQSLTHWREFRTQHPKTYFAGADELLKEIENRRQLHYSDLLWKSSSSLESQARSLHQRSSSDASLESEALRLMKQAYADQKQINDEFPASNRANYPRCAELLSWIQTIEAQPLYVELQQWKTLADSSLADSQWLMAIEQLQCALKIQNLINHSFPESPRRI